MTSPKSHDEYIATTRALFPRGPIWFDLDDDEGGPKGLAVRALAKDPARINDDIEQWIDDRMLDTLSPEVATWWERAMELDATGLTIEQRRAQIISLWRGYGDPTLALLQSVADAWGVNAVLSEFQFPLFEMGIGHMGDPIRGDEWAVTLLCEYPGPINPAFEAALASATQATTTILFVRT